MLPRIPWEFGKKKPTAPVTSDQGATAREQDALDELLKKWARSESTGGDAHTANRIGDAHFQRGQRVDALEWYEKAMVAYLDKGMFAPAYSVGIKAESRSGGVLPTQIHELLIQAAARRHLLSDVEDRVRSYLALVAAAQDDRIAKRAINAILIQLDSHEASTVELDRLLMPWHAMVQGAEAAATRAYRRAEHYRRRGKQQTADDLANIARQMAPDLVPPITSPDSPTNPNAGDNEWLFDLQDAELPTTAPARSAPVDDEDVAFIDFASDPEPLDISEVEDETPVVESSTAPASLAAPDASAPDASPLDTSAPDEATFDAPAPTNLHADWSIDTDGSDIDREVTLPAPASDSDRHSWFESDLPKQAIEPSTTGTHHDPPTEEAEGAAPTNATDHPDGMEQEGRPAEPRRIQDPGMALEALHGPRVAEHLASLLAQASQHFEATISADDYEQWYDLGVTYAEMGLYEQAIVELRKAANSPVPTRRLAVAEALGDCLIHLGHLGVAADYLSRCLPPQPLNDAHLSYLGIAYLAAVALTATENAAAARPLFEFVVRFEPDFKDSLERLQAIVNATPEM